MHANSDSARSFSANCRHADDHCVCASDNTRDSSFDSSFFFQIAPPSVCRLLSEDGSEEVNLPGFGEWKETAEEAGPAGPDVPKSSLFGRTRQAEFGPLAEALCLCASVDRHKLESGQIHKLVKDNLSSKALWVPEETSQQLQ